MKKRFLAVLALPAILAACAADTDHPTVVTKSDLVAHNWVLTKVDNKVIELPEPYRAPTLELNQEMSANGHSGCNRYFGQAELKDGKLRIEKMGMTMMACVNPATMKMEELMSSTLMEWSNATIQGNELTLTNAEHSLTFLRSNPQQK